MSELISNVLDLMRFESGHVPLRRQWETIDDLVGLALSRVESRLGSRPVSVELPADLPPVHVDAVLFTQVVVNLLENAAKHTPDGTPVRVTASSRNGEVALSSTTTARACRRVTRTSCLPSSSVVEAKVTLLVRGSGSPSAARLSKLTEARSSRPIATEAARDSWCPCRRRKTHVTETMFRILVIEDDSDLRDVLRALLVSEGYRVIEADTAVRALIEARSHKPDAVLVDLGLPDRDGQVVIRRIREFSSVPIIVLSARTMDAEKVLAFDGGADDYVTKPFSSVELLARVRAALRRGAQPPDQPATLRIGDLTVNLGTREVVRPGGSVHFTPIEYRLLTCLARGHGLVVSRTRSFARSGAPIE